jgi:hypothetical protein
MSDTPGDLASMARLAPGVYDDGKGGLHLEVNELLEANGFEPTPENIRRLDDEIKTIAGAYGIDYVAEG